MEQVKVRVQRCSGAGAGAGEGAVAGVLSCVVCQEVGVGA